MSTINTFHAIQPLDVDHKRYMIADLKTAEKKRFRRYFQTALFLKSIVRESFAL